MARIPDKHLRLRIDNVPVGATVYAEPNALRIDGNGDGWIDPEIRAFPGTANSRFDFAKYIEIRKTPQGLIVAIPSNGIWDEEPFLVTDNLLTIFQFIERGA